MKKPIVEFVIGKKSRAILSKGRHKCYILKTEVKEGKNSQHFANRLAVENFASRGKDINPNPILPELAIKYEYEISGKELVVTELLPTTRGCYDYIFPQNTTNFATEKSKIRWLATVYNLVLLRNELEQEQEQKWHEKKQQEQEQKQKEQALKKNKDTKELLEDKLGVLTKYEKREFSDIKTMQSEIKSCLCQTRSFNVTYRDKRRYTKATYKKRGKRKKK
jgi:hypothetical protein